MQIFTRSVNSESANLRQGNILLLKLNGSLLIPSSVFPKFLKISLKSVHNFLSNPVTNKQAQTSAKATNRYQNLLACYLYHPQSILKISSKSIHKFSSNILTDRQTDIGSLPKSNHLFLIAFLTFSENFIKFHP